MATSEGDVGGIMESHEGDSFKPEEQFSDTNYYKHRNNGNLVLENGLSDGNPCPADTHDELLQMVFELRFQNEFLKCQFECFNNLNSVHSYSSLEKKVCGPEGGESDIVEELQGRIQALNKELLDEKQTRSAAEEALKHLQMQYSEADAKAHELSEKLAEGMILFVFVCESYAAIIIE